MGSPRNSSYTKIKKILSSQKATELLIEYKNEKADNIEYPNEDTPEYKIEVADKIEYRDEDIIESSTVLGKGSFGEIRKATWKNQDVAIKYCKDTNNDCHKTYLKNEFNILSELDHPNIIKVYGTYKSASGGDGMVMELMDRSLDKYLMDNKVFYPLTMEQIQNIAYPVISALKHTHDRGILHRDIKIHNVLVREQNNICDFKLHDFGFAVKVDPQGVYYHNAYVGTADYRAPEIIKEQVYSKASDMWAFGALMHEIISCKSFLIDDGIYTRRHTHAKVLAGKIAPIRWSDSFDTGIFQRCFEANPEQRMTAEELANTLKPR